MRLQGKTIGYLVAQEVEDLEYWVPLMRLHEEGAKVISIGLTTQTVRGKHGLEMTPDVSIDEAPQADELDGLVIPGSRYLSRRLGAHLGRHYAGAQSRRFSWHQG